MRPAPLFCNALGLSLVLLPGTARAQPRVTIEPYCDNALRIRISSVPWVPHGPSTMDASAGALQDTCGGGPPVAPPPEGAPVTNGNIYASVVGGILNVRAVDTGVALLSGKLPIFGQPTCTSTRTASSTLTGATNSFSSFNVSFATPSRSRGPSIGGRITYFGQDRIYGLGQLEGAQSSCADISGSPSPHSGCAPPLNRRKMTTIPVRSVKYHIGIPWLYSTAGFGVFFNQPGDGTIVLNATGSDGSGGGWINASFGCQYGLDMLVIVAPDDSISPHTDIYHTYAQATGLPTRLPDNAALYWQSKDAYKNQSEVVALAQKFKDKGLNGSVGVIVCDLPEPTESPYYRFDPARFPDVKAMAAQVKDLTGGATLMPNIKPTGVDSTDCPTCGTQHPHGDGVNGKPDGEIDASIADCRACVWDKRVKPLLYDRGVTGFWLDDDEGADFHLRAPKPNGPACPPGTHPNPQPCPTHKGKTFCASNSAPDQCESPPQKTCPPCPQMPQSANATSWSCGPPEYCGMSLAGLRWPQLFAGKNISAPLVLSRNAWAGAAAYGTALWSSDIVCTWNELAAQVPTGLSSGLSGIPYWSSDVGGFSGTPTPELAARWHQFGSVCPLYRSHGMTAREPWAYGSKAEASIVKSIALRKHLHGYIMKLVTNASTFGTPLMRPVWWDFDDERALEAEETTFMFGPDYFVVPVLAPNVTAVEVYFPRGASFTHFYSGKAYRGGTKLSVPTPFDELAIFKVHR